MEANTTTNKTLRPCIEESKDWDNTENLYIEGDNLEVLKLLQNSYFNKVKMIYIDPPYNTGNDFIYVDDFAQNIDEYEEAKGSFDEEGNRLFKNTDTNGRFHSDWCSMIYPRLVLARNLLADDGAIFISIDDNEYDNLKKICDEVFGSENYLTTFHLQVRYGDKSINEEKIFKPMIEYVLIYAKNQKKYVANQPTEEYGLDKFIFSIEEKEASEVFFYNEQKVEVFKKGQWKLKKMDQGKINLLKETWISGSIYTNMSYGKVFQKVVEPRINLDGLGCLYKIYGRGDDGLGYRYYTGPSRAGATRGKMYSGVPIERVKDIKNSDISIRKKPIQCFYDFSPDFGNIRHEGNVVFNSGKKPVKMLKQFINYCPDKNALILDFFSGSASTAESVMRLNLEDQGKRKYIMVQLPEKVDKNKAGFKNICKLGKQRIRNAGEKIKEEAGLNGQDLDIGFRVLKLDSSNMKDIYYSADEYDQGMLENMQSNTKEDRTDLDLLFGCLVDWGLELDKPYTTKVINGHKVHIYNDGDLVACFEKDLDMKTIDEIAKLEPLRVVFCDNSFVDSATKINVAEHFKMIAPDTDIKVI
ncbi:site-specific DNA-methyltransferase [Megamonas funiformis]|uniref:site-specific DNA-methyltransferase n=1 Tax=Megamonas funiformis TaxID=437897 RepID=UPI003A92B37E